MSKKILIYLFITAASFTWVRSPLAGTDIIQTTLLKANGVFEKMSAKYEVISQKLAEVSSGKILDPIYEADAMVQAEIDNAEMMYEKAKRIATGEALSDAINSEENRRRDAMNSAIDKARNAGIDAVRRLGLVEEEKKDKPKNTSLSDRGGSSTGSASSNTDTGVSRSASSDNSGTTRGSSSASGSDSLQRNTNSASSSTGSSTSSKDTSISGRTSSSESAIGSSALGAVSSRSVTRAATSTSNSASQTTSPALTDSPNKELSAESAQLTRRKFINVDQSASIKEKSDDVAK